MIRIKVNDFSLDDSITCGQIFRYDKEEDGSYTLPINDRIVNIKQDRIYYLYLLMMKTI
jgi:hypothetical protein